MTIKYLRPLICLAVFLCAASAFAQTISIGSTNANPGDTGVCLPVTVSVAGQSHDNTSLEVVLSGGPPALAWSSPEVDGTGSIYGAGTFALLPGDVATGQAPVLTSTTMDGLVFSLCFDVDGGATAGTIYDVSAVAGLNTGIFFAGSQIATSASPGQITIIPEPGSGLLLLIAGLGVLAVRQR